eukprot:g7997.t1
MVNASYCTGGPKKNAKPNLYPITEPKIVHVADYYSKTNGSGGRLFNAIHTVGNTTFPVLHLYGNNGYEMGYSQGTLLKDKLLKMWTGFFDYVVTNTPGGLKTVEKILIPLAQDSRAFIPKHFTDELQGLADATGYNYTKLLWIHLFPESAVGHCSMFGAWGKATSKSYGGKLLQMRALDYITADFLSENHALTVYHPTDGESYINIGFIGTITLVTGVSNAKISLSQIGVSNPDSTFGPQRNGQGIPFNFLLRDILQYQTNLNDVETALEDATRTIDLILGFGSGATENNGIKTPFIGVQYAANQIRVYDDTNMLPVNNTWHPPIENVVYHGMDWDCPAWTSLLGKKILEEGYKEGMLTAEKTIRYVNPIVQTGNLHVAIYEPNNAIFYLSQSIGSKMEGPKFAYERPYLRLNATVFFNVPLKGEGELQ